MTRKTISSLKILYKLQLQMILTSPVGYLNRAFLTHKRNYREEFNTELFDENYDIKWKLIK